VSSQSENRSIRVWSNGWFWLAVLARAVLAGLADMADFTGSMAVVDDRLPVGMLERLDHSRRVYLNEESRDLAAGNSEWKRGNSAAAIQEWQKVVSKHGRSESAFRALENIGRAAFAMGDRNTAIAALREIVETPIATPQQKFLVGDSCSAAKHQACIQLSDLMLETGDSRSSLKYATLALNTYDSGEWCGFATATENAWLEHRINAINSALAHGQPIAMEPRSTAEARFYADRGPTPANVSGEPRPRNALGGVR
jgi:hypothetical protein